MRKFLKIFLFFVCFCKAQSSLINLYDVTTNNVKDAYYKDLNFYLYRTSGTYEYMNGDTKLKIVLLKKDKVFNGISYEDVLVGCYQYIKDGVEIINTLTGIDNKNLNYRDFSIYCDVSTKISYMQNKSDGYFNNFEKNILLCKIKLPNSNILLDMSMANYCDKDVEKLIVKINKNDNIDQSNGLIGEFRLVKIL